MKRKTMMGIVAGAVLAMAASAPASAREFADIYTECGLGAMIAPTNSAVAAVTNVTWDLGTTAISSNASSPESCQGGKPKKAAFIHDSYAQLESDLARGDGRHLGTLMDLAGCNAAVRGQVATVLRGDFAQLVKAPGYATQSRYEQAKALFDAVNTRLDGTFAGACTAL